MDIEANLREQRELAAKILRIQDDPGGPELPADVVQLAELFQAMDEWLKDKGFLPKDWTSDSAMKLRVLLTKYINHVGSEEGVTFIRDEMFGFTEEEVIILKVLEGA